MKRILFIDFDGTITSTDTCDAMIMAFARDGWQEINRLWENKEISTQECAEQTFSLFQAGPEDIRQFLNTMVIDGYFQTFVDFCRTRDYAVYILSDGYDVNITSILQRYSVDLPYYSNRLIYTGQFHIESPYKNDECGLCGTCKSRLMEQLNPHGYQTIYIGDGYSDTCPAAKADQVFAKGNLLNYCRENNIPAVSFENFQDIIRHLEADE